jgi:hypothetical protein
VLDSTAVLFTRVRLNGLKSLGRSSSGMPCPWSAIAIIAADQHGNLSGSSYVRDGCVHVSGDECAAFMLQFRSRYIGQDLKIGSERVAGNPQSRQPGERSRHPL